MIPGNWRAIVDTGNSTVALVIQLDPQQMTLAAPHLLAEQNFVRFISELQTHYRVMARDYPAERVG